MASILPAFANIVAPGNYQVPNGQLQIDWTQSLANGLVGCYLPGVTMAEITGIGPTLAFVSGTGLQTSMSNEGPGVNYTITNGGGLLGSPIGNSFITQNAFTLFWRGLLLATSGFSGFASLVGVNYSQPNANPFNLWSLGLGSAGGPSLGIAWNHGGSQLAWNSGSASPLTANLSLGMHDYAATFTVGTSGLVIAFVDGALWQTNPVNFGAGQPTSTATSYINVGLDKGAVTNIACLWNRNLSTAEIMQMHLAPYSFLIPADTDMPSQAIVVPPILMPQIVT